MGRQSSEWDAVLGALRAAGVPGTIRKRIIAILVDARFEGRAASCRSSEKPPRPFVSVAQLEGCLMKRMEAEQSCLETCERQAEYHYARLAVLQRAEMGGSDA